MSNIREGNVRVYYLEREIREALNVLRARPLTERSKRQLVDGAKFLEMIKHTPYSRYTTVASLKERIVKERNKLKAELVKIDTGSSGHQITIYEMLDERSEEEKKRHAGRVAKLKDEIHWLHKCLGICKNTDYFK
ncbi:MAG: hypothetical protein IKL68_03425 [Clostridia bacterium]|nr:hypothetical protein [Clostridia bacterium]